MVKESIGTFNVLNKLQQQENQFGKELAKTFLEYLSNLSLNKRIEQVESILSETKIKNLVTLGRRLTLQEKKCLFWAAKGKSIKETARILQLSYHTVQEYRASAIKKLEAPNVTAAVVSAIQSNAISHSDHLNAENLIDDLPGNIYWKRRAGDKLIYSGVNRTSIDGLRKMGFGWNINDIIGKTDDSLFDKETADIFIRNDWEVIHKGVVMVKEEAVILPSGKKITQLSTKKPLFSEDNKIIGIIGITVDIPICRALSLL